MSRLGCGHQAIGSAPFPTGDGITLHPLLQIRRGHRIDVNTHVLCEKTREGFKTPAFQVCRKDPQTPES